METMISACHTATELAETASVIRQIGRHLNDPDFEDFYQEKLKRKICHYAGLSVGDEQFLDETIDECF